MAAVLQTEEIMLSCGSFPPGYPGTKFALASMQECRVPEGLLGGQEGVSAAGFGTEVLQNRNNNWF